ncbi:MAG: hypothetical protein RBG13Loki_2340 [Promethearchaeota archaeon CR_4]|nr:MAG: hypothetical protein RBG13Loki_2340 [Candidatus Lokiarchaeota archaeon CR_4]
MTDAQVSPAKIHLEIFVPLSTCACVYQQFLDQIFAVLHPYKHCITFQVKNGASPEADKYEIFQNTVVVNGGEKFTRATELETYLRKIFGFH